MNVTFWIWNISGPLVCGDFRTKVCMAIKTEDKNVEILGSLGNLKIGNRDDKKVKSENTEGNNRPNPRWQTGNVVSELFDGTNRKWTVLRSGPK